MKYIVTCSGGNDSVALIQYMIDNHSDFVVVYNDTGWAKQGWADRINEIKNKCDRMGIKFYITGSEGMASLVRRKKGWPMPASKMQFCTSELKEKPSNELYSVIDPECAAAIVTGRRREESQNRASLALWQFESERHGGRDVFNPLVNFDEKDRDDLVWRFGFEPLPHSSMECYPCVCANKSDLAAIPKNDSKIDLIEQLEIEMGFTKNKKPRTMFRPYRVGGGVGIRQAIDWGHGERGYKSKSIPDEYIFKGSSTEDGENDSAYDANTLDSRQCVGGFCGG